MRSLREDRAIIETKNFIAHTLGKEFVESLAYPIEDIWQESTAVNPIIYLLSVGADPTFSIEELAKIKNKFPCGKVSMS